MSFFPMRIILINNIDRLTIHYFLWIWSIHCKIKFVFSKRKMPCKKKVIKRFRKNVKYNGNNINICHKIISMILRWQYRDAECFGSVITVNMFPEQLPTTQYQISLKYSKSTSDHSNHVQFSPSIPFHIFYPKQGKTHTNKKNIENYPITYINLPQFYREKKMKPK